MIRRGLLLILLCGIGEAAFGASFVVPPDRDFVRRAPAIVIASALASRTQLNNEGGIETITTLSIEESLKGSFSTDMIDIYEPGGVYRNRTVIIAGVPTFKDGERYILFLNSTNDGRWHVLDLILGKFTFATDTLGHDVVVRDFRDVLTLDRDGAKHVEANRAEQPFIDFVRQTARGGPTREDYAIPEEPLIGSTPSPGQILSSGRKIVNLTTFSATSYTLASTTETSTGFRWCGTIVAGTCVTAFPTAVSFGSINNSSETGAPGSPPGSTAINAAMNAWNTAPSASVNYAYSGVDGSGTTNSPCLSGDGKNTIAFEYDLSCTGGMPFSCATGGLLGLGGISAASGTHSGPNSETFNTTLEGDVWMNQGIAGCTTLFSSGDFNSAVTHEVGHTLGFRHADQNRLSNAACSTDVSLECASTAIMKATVTGGLNAALQPWDQHAVAALYPGAAAPAAPTGVVATATTSTNVQVSWSGLCVTTCHVYRSADHLTYSQVGSSATSPFNDTTAVAKKSYLYKVRAFNGTTESADSNIDLATTVIYTNTIVAGSSIIQAVDINEMRDAVDAVRSLDGIGPGFYTYGSGSPLRIAVGTIIHAADINEMRTNLNTAYNGLFGTTPTYTNTITSGSSVILAIDFNEIRNDMR